MTVPSWFLLTGSTVVMATLAAGFLLRRRRAWHWRLMTAAFVIDVSLVAIIELGRGAVETGMSTTSPLMLVHIAASVGTLVGYGALIYLGRRLIRGDEAARRLHLRWAMAFAALRSVNYVTSFFVV